MKKIFCLIFIIVFCITGCMINTEKPEEIEPEINVTEEDLLPEEKELGNIKFSIEELSETLVVEFDENGTKVRLNNNDGKYFLVNYILENNESFEIDIDHSLEVILIDEKGEKHYGEYYEYETGRENPTLKSGGKANVLFVSDMSIDTKIVTVVLKYSDAKYEYQVK